MAKPVVLYACVHNGGRSLAKVLTEHYAQGARRRPLRRLRTGDSLNPQVVAVLEERGLSVAGEAPIPIPPDTVETSYVIITQRERKGLLRHGERNRSTCGRLARVGSGHEGPLGSG